MDRFFRRLGIPGTIALIGALIVVGVFCFKVIYDDRQFNSKIAVLREVKALANDKNYEDAYQKFNRLATGDELKNYPELQAEAVFRAAHTLQMLGRYDEALDRYNNFMTQFPDSQWVENALYARGLCYDSLRDHEASRNSFTECLNRFPNTQFKTSLQNFLKQSFLMAAKTLANDKNYEDAYQEFNRLATGDELKNYPELQAEAVFRAAHTLQMLGRYDEALDRYNNFMTQFPDSQWIENTLYLIGVLNFYDLSNYDACRDSLKKLLAEYPSSAFKDRAQRLLKESFLKEAQLLLVEENYEDAYQEFNRLATGEEFKEYRDLQTEARSKATYSFLKWVGKDDEKFIPYVDFLTESSETEFVEDSALFNIGILSFKLQSYEVSLSAFEQLRENVFDSALKEKALYNIGMANYNLQNYEDSHSALTEFLSEFPNSVLKEKALYYKGLTNYNLQNYEDSRSNFRELLANFPNRYLRRRLNVSLPNRSLRKLSCCLTRRSMN